MRERGGGRVSPAYQLWDSRAQPPGQSSAGQSSQRPGQRTESEPPWQTNIFKIFSKYCQRQWRSYLMFSLELRAMNLRSASVTSPGPVVWQSSEVISLSLSLSQIIRTTGLLAGAALLFEWLSLSLPFGESDTGKFPTLHKEGRGHIINQRNIFF